MSSQCIRLLHGPNVSVNNVAAHLAECRSTCPIGTLVEQVVHRNMGIRARSSLSSGTGTHPPLDGMNSLCLLTQCKYQPMKSVYGWSHPSSGHVASRSPSIRAPRSKKWWFLDYVSVVYRAGRRRTLGQTLRGVLCVIAVETPGTRFRSRRSTRARSTWTNSRGSFWCDTSWLRTLNACAPVFYSPLRHYKLTLTCFWMRLLYVGFQI